MEKTMEEKNIIDNLEEAETVESVLIDQPELDGVPTITLQQAPISEYRCFSCLGWALDGVLSGIRYGVRSFEHTFCFLILRRPEERNRNRRNILKTVRI